MAYDFYDIESLQNIFTVVTYQPKDEGDSSSRARINIYYMDDDDLIGQMTKTMLPEQFVTRRGNQAANPKYWSDEAMQIRYANMLGRNETLARICERIREKNPIIADIDPLIVIYDLHTPVGAYHFAREFLWRPDPALPKIMREVRMSTNIAGKVVSRSYVPERDVVSDTDEAFEKNPKAYPYLLGYNSYNYDTTMIAYVLTHMFDVVDTWTQDELTKQEYLVNQPVDLETENLSGMSKTLCAHDIRIFNDALFSETYRSNMFRALRDPKLCHCPASTPEWRNPANLCRDRMIRTGRHMDVARLNEKQSKVGLKRLLGMMGYQILESDKLSEQTSELITFDELCDLFAYNVSDVVYLAALFEDPVYKSQFEQKSNMLSSYPELVYNYKDNKVVFDTAPDGSRKARVDKTRVRANRLYADSSSQQLASRSLCPEGALHDLPKVSLMYPHEKNTHTNNPEIPENVFRRDILEEAREFFMGEVLPRIKAADPIEAERAEKDFTHIYTAYRTITEHNFDGGRVLTDDIDAGISRAAQEMYAISEKHDGFLQEDDFDVIADMLAKQSSKENNFDVIADMLAKQSSKETKQALAVIKNLTENDKFSLMCAMSTGEDITNTLHRIYAEQQTREIAASLPYNIFYYDGEGRRTSCFATFSTGGVHGAEFAMAAYEKDLARTREYNANLAFLQKTFGADDAGARALRASVKPSTTPISKDAEGNPITLPDGKKDHLVTEFLKTKTLAGATWAAPKECHIFESKADGSNKLRSAYTWTSAAYVNHEDFSSYYPSLLRMMRVFYNEQLGYDRYGEIYADKERLGRLMKATTDREKRYKLGLDRNGVKLILNTASGAGDAKFDNPVRMNNNIIAMRIIGQLFTWRIGQAQALHGAKVVSTNTDGLYTKLEREENDRLLAIEADKIGVVIEPEPMYLISKDSNNRIEFDIVACSPEEAPIVGFEDDGTPIRATVDMRRGLTYEDGTPVPEGTPIRFRVLSVAGATLACREGPNPARSLAHPAATDWALSEYLMRTFARYGYRQSALEKPFDKELGRQIIEELHALGTSKEKSDRVHGLMMFQNVIASNPSSFTYVYTNNLTPDQEEMLARFEWWDDEDTRISPAGPAFYDNHGHVRTTQHYNRVFVMRPGTTNTTHIYDAVARVVPKPTIVSRKKRGFDDHALAQEKSASATWVMSEQGLSIADVKGYGLELRDIISKKHSGIECTWPMRIENADLWRLPDAAVAEIYSHLDLDIYQLLLEEVFEKNWRNRL